MTKRVAVVVVLVAIVAGVFAISASLAAEGGKVVPYPLDTCIVSGEKLGVDGDPVVLVDQGQEFKFCCKHCVKDFKADPAKFHKKLEEEIVKAQLPGYPLDTCVVSGEALGADAINYVHEGRLVRFCCKQCIKDFQADPAKFLAKLDAAAKK